MQMAHTVFIREYLYPTSSSIWRAQPLLMYKILGKVSKTLLHKNPMAHTFYGAFHRLPLSEHILSHSYAHGEKIVPTLFFEGNANNTSFSLLHFLPLPEGNLVYQQHIKEDMDIVQQTFFGSNQKGKNLKR